MTITGDSMYSVKVGIVCSQGGHLTEAMQVMDAFEGFETFIASYSGSREDELRQKTSAYFTPYTGVDPISAFKYFIWALRILFKERPDVIFSTGAEIALPFFYVGKLMGIKLIYLEDWCNVKRISKTGRLVYPIADVFLVQWPQLLEVCGNKARYIGSVI